MRKQETINLKSGHQLAVKAIQIRETYYGEILVGEPEQEDNLRVYSKLQCPNDWTVTKAIYDKEDFNLDQKTFKPYTVWVWFESDKSVKDPEKKFDSSELAISFTVENILDISLKSLIEIRFKDFPWNDFAVNLKL